MKLATTTRRMDCGEACSDMVSAGGEKMRRMLSATLGPIKAAGQSLRRRGAHGLGGDQFHPGAFAL